MAPGWSVNMPTWGLHIFCDLINNDSGQDGVIKLSISEEPVAGS